MFQNELRFCLTTKHLDTKYIYKKNTLTFNNVLLNFFEFFIKKQTSIDFINVGFCRTQEGPA